MGLTEKDDHSDEVKGTESILHISIQTGGSFQCKVKHNLATHFHLL